MTDQAVNFQNSLQTKLSVGVGVSPSTAAGIYLSGVTAVTAGVAQYGIQSSLTYTSAATTSMAGLYALVTGGAGTYTTTNLYGLLIDTTVKGGSQTVTNNYGMSVNAQTATCTTAFGLQIGAVSGGATNNYGAYISTPTGTGAVGLYVAGAGVTIAGGGLNFTQGAAATIGTTDNNNLQFKVNGTVYWAMGTGGSFLGNLDNTYDIGGSNANRPRRLYLSGFLELGGAGSTNNQFSTGSTGAGTTTMYIGNASINVTSDVRVKTAILPTQCDALSLMKRLPVVDYTWNDPSDTAVVNRNSRGRWTGLVAQDIIDVVPWVVNAPERSCWRCRSGQACPEHPSLWQVEFGHMTGLFVKGFQELTARVEALEAK